MALFSPGSSSLRQCHNYTHNPRNDLKHKQETSTACFLLCIFSQIKIEDTLVNIEKDWASFCNEVAEERVEVDRVVSLWVDQENNYKGLKTFLNDTSQIYEEDLKDGIDHCNLQHLIARYQV